MAAGMINRIALLIRERFSEDNHYAMAIAVLEAMREPTKEMIKAGAVIMPINYDDPDDNNVKTVFQAMIDRALQE